MDTEDKKRCRFFHQKHKIWSQKGNTVVLVCVRAQVVFSFYLTVLTIIDVLYKPHDNKKSKSLVNTQRKKNLSVPVEKVTKEESNKRRKEPNDYKIARKQWKKWQLQVHTSQ